MFVVNDGREELRGNVTWSLYDLEGNVLRREECLVRAGSESAVTLLERPVGWWTEDPSSTFLEMSLEGMAGGRIVEGGNTLFFRRFRDMPLEPVSIECEPVWEGERLGFRLACDRPAFYVTLEEIGSAGYLSDNSVTLLPGEERVVWLQAREGLEAGRLREVAERVRVLQVNAMGW